MNEIKPFDFNGTQIRTILIDDVIWFIGKDVATVLGYVNSRKAIKDHVFDEDKNTVTIRDGIGNPNKTVINESGVYALIFGSNLPSAKDFKRWVTSVVLPTLRQEGSYKVGEESEPQIAESNFGPFADAIPTNMSEALRLAADLKEEADYYKPRAQRYDLYMASRFYWTITQIAENYGMTAWQLNDLLAQLGIQYKRGERWYLYAPYKNMGYKVQRPGVSKTGKRYTSSYWTESGRMFINDQLEKLNLRDINVRNYMGDKKIIPLNQQRDLF